MDLRTYRKSQGLSQGQLAEMLGLSSKGHISDIERGTQAPSLAIALKIEAWSRGKVSAASLVPQQAAA